MKVCLFFFSETLDREFPEPGIITEKKMGPLSSLGRGNRKRKPRKFFDEETSGLRSSAAPSPSSSSDHPKHRRLSASTGKLTPVMTSSSAAAATFNNVGSKSASNQNPVVKTQHDDDDGDDDGDCPEQSMVRSSVFQPGKMKAYLLKVRGGGCIAQRKHSCFPPISSGFESRLSQDFSLNCLVCK